MNKAVFVLIGIAVLALSCTRTEQPQAAPFVIFADLGGNDDVKTTLYDPDTGFTSTIGEETGAFAFTPNDQIKTNGGSGMYVGTTQSSKKSGDFVMEDGYVVTLSQAMTYVGFPAAMVLEVVPATGRVKGVSFTLPHSYSFEEVGGADPNTAKVPCPMMGDLKPPYTSSSLKHVAAMLRFRLTNVAAGSISFNFESYVTGSTDYIQTSTAYDGGIREEGLLEKTRGKTITVTGVPDVPTGSYIFISLPVPTRTLPQNISVTNQANAGASENRSAFIQGFSTPMQRAHFRKLGVSFTKTSD